MAKRFDKFFVMGNPPDYEPGPEKSVAAIAAREGRTPDEVAYDYSSLYGAVALLCPPTQRLRGRTDARRRQHPGPRPVIPRAQN